MNEIKEDYVERESALVEKILLRDFRRDSSIHYQQFQSGDKGTYTIGVMVMNFFSNLKERIEQKNINPLDLVILTQSKLFELTENSPLREYFVLLRDNLIKNYFNQYGDCFASNLEKAVDAVKKGNWPEIYNQAGEDIFDALAGLGYISKN